jgi:hypothetical protein
MHTNCHSQSKRAEENTVNQIVLSYSFPIGRRRLTRYLLAVHVRMAFGFGSIKLG